MHCKSYSHFFSKKFQHICVSLNVNFNESITNDVVSCEQLGPAYQITWYKVVVQIHNLNDKQRRSWSDGFFESQLIWIYTIDNGRGCRVQQDKSQNFPFLFSLTHEYITQLWTNLLFWGHQLYGLSLFQKLIATEESIHKHLREQSAIRNKSLLWYHRKHNIFNKSVSLDWALLFFHNALKHLSFSD